MLISKIDGSKRSDQWIGRHFEFQYGRHNETLNITILGSKWPVALCVCVCWGGVIRAVRVASEIELHVTTHEDSDGRLMPPYMKITYTDIRRDNESMQVYSW